MDEPAIEELGRASYVSLATFRRNGRAVETPVEVCLTKAPIIETLARFPADESEMEPTQRRSDEGGTA